MTEALTVRSVLLAALAAALIVPGGGCRRANT